MIKLNRIKVSNFKNIKDADVAFGDFNVIVGPNNSGKSNFLQVLGFLNHIFNNDLLGRDPYLDSFFMETTNRLQETEIEVFYEEEETKIECTYYIHIKHSSTNYFTIVSEKLTSKLKGKTGAAQKIFNRENKKVSFNEKISSHKLVSTIQENLPVIKLVSLIDTFMSQGIISKPVNLLIDLIGTPIYYFNPYVLKSGRDLFKDDKLRRLSPNIAKEFQYLSDEQKKQFNTALSGILQIDRITVSRGLLVTGIDSSGKPASLPCPPELIGFERNGVNFNINGLSDGSLIILGFLISIFFESIFLVEEPENSIHPKALQDLIEFMKDNAGEKQFILTTHSPIVVNMAQPEEIIIAQLAEDGTSTIANVSNPKEIHKLLRNGFSTLTEEVFFNYGKESIFES